MRTTRSRPKPHSLSLLLPLLALAIPAYAQVDPGPRGGVANAGGPLAGLSAVEVSAFNDAKQTFVEIDSVSGGIVGEDGSGLGPTFNANSCASCHAQPAVGGTSPHPRLGQVRRVNPQIAFATLDRLAGRNQIVPSFILADGPVREARFVRNADGTPDGGVHGLFTIAGRVDAPASCATGQPNFAAQLAANNVIFRIPTPVFGLGLVDNTSEEQLTSRFANTATQRAAFGIKGHFNRNGNDGTITRFGWKAQNKSLVIFAGEAYNVEQGITNEVFPTATEEDPSCNGARKPAPNDVTRMDANDDLNQAFQNPVHILADWMQFSLLMRFTDGPQPAPNPSHSAQRGRQVFADIGCALCHTPTMQTAPVMNSAVLQNRPVNMFSDLLVHDMGAGLADGISQGAA